MTTSKIRSSYYSPHSFSVKFENTTNRDVVSDFSIPYTNIRSLRKNIEHFQCQVLSKVKHNFTVLGVTGTRLCEGESIDFIPQLPGYCFEFVKTPLSAGGVGLLINENYKYRVLERSTNCSYQALWIEILLQITRKISVALFTDNIIMQTNFLTIFRIPSSISVIIIIIYISWEISI